MEVLHQYSSEEAAAGCQDYLVSGDLPVVLGEESDVSEGGVVVEVPDGVGGVFTVNVPGQVEQLHVGLCQDSK